MCFGGIGFNRAGSGADVARPGKRSHFTEFSWFYVLTFSIFLGFLLILSVSGLGNIRLGRDEDVPEFGFLSWLAMLFAAGMGVGLMFSAWQSR